MLRTKRRRRSTRRSASGQADRGQPRSTRSAAGAVKRPRATLARSMIHVDLHSRMRRTEMRARHRFVVSMIVALLALPAAAQDRGQRGGAPAAPPLTLAIAAFPDGSDIPVK